MPVNRSGHGAETCTGLQILGLQIADPLEEISSFTHASKGGLGAVLLQRRWDGYVL